VVTKSINSDSTNFGIFTGGIVFGYERLDLVAHRVLASYCGKTCRFCPTTSGSKISPMSSFNSSQFSDAFTTSQRSMKSSFKSFE
jgi:hypothetical protein